MLSRRRFGEVGGFGLEGSVGKRQLGELGIDELRAAAEE